jgi:hypothetical protein
VPEGGDPSSATVEEEGRTIARRHNGSGEDLTRSVWYHYTRRMFEQFSRGYYLGRLYVKPGDSETPKMCDRQYDQVTGQLYDRPVPPVMKVGRHHFAVEGEAGVPTDTLAVPESVLDGADVDNPPALTEVFLAKADRAAQLLSLTDGSPL